VGAGAVVTDRTNVTGAKVAGSKVVLQLYQMEQTANATFTPFTGNQKNINLAFYQLGQEKVNSVSGLAPKDQIYQGDRGSIFVSFTNGESSVEIN
jgi:hypothetical protein